jgi:hypothetical protein
MAENPPARPVRELGQERGREYLPERGKLANSGWGSQAEEFTRRGAIALEAFERSPYRHHRIAEHLGQQRKRPAGAGQSTRISVVAADRAGEGGGAPVEYGVGVVAERLGDLDERVNHSGTASAQGRARGCEREGRTGVQHEPQEPVGRCPDGAWVGFLPVRGRHYKGRCGLAVAALYVAQPTGEPIIEETSNG